MEFMDVIRKRRSIRRYKPDPVPEEEIKYIMEAARLAPSWANTQCWRFVVVTDPAVKEDLGKEILGVPDNIRVVECIPIGYPAQDPAPRSRKSLEEVFSYNHY